mmetsp:Transcript_10079/g.31319  ORF Transcript_10079/g.31319 Transcript_10079/m.31319 type:complete len:216 (+) Transcript_10079:530-1177(+)
MRKTTRRPGRAGSSPRRSSPSAGAAACAVSICAARPPATRPPPPRHPIPIPKTTQRRSQAGSSPIPSSPTAGAAAWAAFPQAAPDRHRPLAPRARRHQQSSQLSRRAPSVLRSAPLPRIVTRGVRPLLSRRRPPLVRPAQQLKEFGCLCGGCGSADTRDAGHRVPLTARDRGQPGAKIELYAAVLSFTLHQAATAGEQAAAAECQGYARSSGVQL